MTLSAILIPARWGSKRFEGKPLCDLDGLPMIRRVHDICAASKIPTFVLTDDVRVANAVNDKCTVIIDKREFNNGTERCAGAIQTDFLKKFDTFINVQGDMPDVTGKMINEINDMSRGVYYSGGVSTLYAKMEKHLQSDENCVKMVHNDTEAHWFGRGITMGSHHLGIYGYSRNMLEKYGTVQDKYEEHEGLEQLRWIAMGEEICIRKVEFDGIEINTPEDAECWNIR